MSDTPPADWRPRRVGVIGAGLMGQGIAEVSARSGLGVVAVETDAGRAEAALAKVISAFDRAASKGKLSGEDRDAAVARLRVTTDFDEVADADIVIEAVMEDEDAKLDVFRRLDKVVVSPHAVLASNTSSIPIMKLGMATTRPDKVVGIHFFNPVPVMQLVELVPSLLTSEGTLGQANTFAVDLLGKHVIRATDRAGFIVNAILVPYLLSAIRMYESGFATAKDIDNGMVLGCNVPLGPLALVDLIGLDTIESVANSLYAEFKEPLHAPPPILSRMVDAGLLGRKAGRGFHIYE